MTRGSGRAQGVSQECEAEPFGVCSSGCFIRFYASAAPELPPKLSVFLHEDEAQG